MLLISSSMLILGVLGSTAGCTGGEEEGAAPADEGAVPAQEAAREAAPAEDSPRLTAAVYERLEVGMTRDQVVEVIGAEGQTVPVEVYEWDNGAVVTFQDGTCKEAIGTTGVLGKTYDEVAEQLGGEGRKLDVTRYRWKNAEGMGSITVDFEEGVVRGMSRSMLPSG
jgi:hypothetical protein